jgi:hypothetical protein
MDNSTLKWFNHNDFNRLEIKQCVGGKCRKEVTVEDVTVIRSLAERISELPTVGDAYISFAKNVKNMELLFISPSGNDVVKIYGSMFKTPATSFTGSKQETVLAEEIEKLYKLNSPSLFQKLIKRLQ